MKAGLMVGSGNSPRLSFSRSTSLLVWVSSMRLFALYVPFAFYMLSRTGSVAISWAIWEHKGFSPQVSGLCPCIDNSHLFPPALDCISAPIYRGGDHCQREIHLWSPLYSFVPVKPICTADIFSLHLSPRLIHRKTSFNDKLSKNTIQSVTHLYNIYEPDC